MKKISRVAASLLFCALLDVRALTATESRESLSATDAKMGNTNESMERPAGVDRKVSSRKGPIDSAQSKADRCSDYCPLANDRGASVSVTAKKRIAK